MDEKNCSKYHTVTIVWTRKIVVSKNKTGANREDLLYKYETYIVSQSELATFYVLDLKLFTSGNPTLK